MYVCFSTFLVPILDGVNIAVMTVVVTRSDCVCVYVRVSVDIYIYMRYMPSVMYKSEFPTPSLGIVMSCD